MTGRFVIFVGAIALLLACGRTEPFVHEEPDAGCTLLVTGSFEPLDVSGYEVFPGTAVQSPNGGYLSWVSRTASTSENKVEWNVRGIERDGSPAPYTEVAQVAYLPTSPPWKYAPGPDLSEGPGNLTALTQDSKNGLRLAVREDDRWRTLGNVPALGEGNFDLLRSDSAGLLLLAERSSGLQLMRLTPADGAQLQSQTLTVPEQTLPGMAVGFDGVGKLAIAWPRSVDGKTEVWISEYDDAGQERARWTVPTKEFRSILTVSPSTGGGWYLVWGSAKDASDVPRALHFAELHFDGTVQELNWGNTSGAFGPARVSSVGGMPLVAVDRTDSPARIEVSRVDADGALFPDTVIIPAEPNTTQLQLVKLTDERTAVVTWEQRKGENPRDVVRVTTVECVR